MKDGAEKVSVEGHGFGKGIVAVAGDEQIILLAAELCIATWDHSSMVEHLERRGSAIAQKRHIAPLVRAHDIGHIDAARVQAAPHQT